VREIKALGAWFDKLTMNYQGVVLSEVEGLSMNDQGVVLSCVEGLTMNSGVSY